MISSDPQRSTRDKFESSVISGRTSLGNVSLIPGICVVCVSLFRVVVLLRVCRFVLYVVTKKIKMSIAHKFNHHVFIKDSVDE